MKKVLNKSNLYKFILPYDKTVKKYLYFLRFSNFLKGIFILVPSLGIKILLDRLIPSKNINNVVIWIIVFIVLSILINFYIFYYVDYLGDKSATIISNDIRKKLLNKTLNISMPTYSKLEKSTLYNVIIEDTTVAIVAFLNDKVFYVIDFLQYIVYLGILFYIQWKIGLIMLLISPLFFAIALNNQEKFYYSSKEERNNADNVIRNFNLIVHAKKQIFLYNKNSYFYHIFEKCINLWGESRIKYNFFYTLFNKIPNALNEITNFLIIGIAAISVIKGHLSIGDLILINQIMAYAFQNLADMVNCKVQVASAENIFERINDLMFIEDNNKSLDTINDECIKFNSIDLKTNEKMLYHVENFIIDEPGIYLIHGKNGTGKTYLFNTITNVVSNNLKKEEKENMQISHLKNIGYFCAPNFFVNDTVLNNITFNEKKDDVFINDIINILEIKNLNYKINLSDLSLSLGEQQKINLARFFVNNKDKPIWLMDEPFTNLDVKIIENLNKFIEQMSENKKILIISHDNLFCETAKQIYNIENKNLVRLK